MKVTEVFDKNTKMEREKNRNKLNEQKTQAERFHPNNIASYSNSIKVMKQRAPLSSFFPKQVNELLDGSLLHITSLYFKMAKKCNAYKLILWLIFPEIQLDRLRQNLHFKYFFFLILCQLEKFWSSVEYLKKKINNILFHCCLKPTACFTNIDCVDLMFVHIIFLHHRQSILPFTSKQNEKPERIIYGGNHSKGFTTSIFRYTLYVLYHSVFQKKKDFTTRHSTLMANMNI